MNRTHLLVIDPQNDFCDLPEAWCPLLPSGERLRPTLAVPGAHGDLLRLSQWIDTHAAQLEAITVTLDAHHRIDIAHPGFWRTGDGSPIAPFTAITAEALRKGSFRTARQEDAARARAYLEALESTGGLTHVVWPIHCQIGSWGGCLHARLQLALDAWEDAHGRSVTHVHKGQNPWTEHFSALRAEVPAPEDPGTGLNRPLLKSLLESGTVLVAGEAGSHCVRATVTHLVENWSGDLSRLVLLADAMSPVSGFEALQAEFLAGMAQRGVQVRSLEDAALRLPQAVR